MGSCTVTRAGYSAYFYIYNAMSWPTRKLGELINGRYITRSALCEYACFGNDLTCFNRLVDVPAKVKQRARQKKRDKHCSAASVSKYRSGIR